MAPASSPKSSLKRNSVLKALRESEEHFRLLFDQSPIGTVLTDLDYRLKRVNQTYCQMLGYTEQELLSLRFTDITHPDDIETNVALQQKVATGEIDSFQIEKRYIRKDGGIVWVSISVRMVRDSEGTPLHFLVMTEDITRRKLMEIDFNRAQSVAQTGSWRLDVLRNELIWSDETYRLFGIRKGTPLDYERFLAHVHPEDRDYVDRKWSAALLGERYDIEHRIVVGDSIKWVREKAELEFSSKGVLQGGFGTVQDITERKRTEEKLKEYEKVVEGVEEMIAVVDKDYRYLIANRAFLTNRDMGSGQVVGRLVPEILGKEVFEGFVKKELDECFKGKVIKYEMKHTYPELGDRDLFISYFPIEGPTGVDRVASVLQDITERKRAEEELRKSRDELELRVKERTADLQKANEQLRRIPSMLMAAQEEERKRIAAELHDSIGQTLAALKFHIEYTTHTLRNGSNQKALELLEEFVPTIQRSIEETRTIYMGLRPKILEDFGAVTALIWYRNELMKLYPERHIEMNINVNDDEIPNDLVVPIFRIAQEALNNVCKHSRAEWVDLSVSGNGVGLELVISDDGRGMDVDYIVKSTLSRSLGLISMRERAELTGGKFSIQSTLGEGTTVRVCWPSSRPS